MNGDKWCQKDEEQWKYEEEQEDKRKQWGLETLPRYFLLFLLFCSTNDYLQVHYDDLMPTITNQCHQITQHQPQGLRCVMSRTQSEFFLSFSFFALLTYIYN